MHIWNTKNSKQQQNTSTKTTISPVVHTSKKEPWSINPEGENCVSGGKIQKQQSNAKGRKQEHINVALVSLKAEKT